VSDEKLKEAAETYQAADYQSPYAELANDLYRERVIRARSASVESKILAGQRLFDAACEITLAGIRHDFPEYSDEECHRVLRERLAMRRKHEAQQ
jgi:hypothetical protein